MADDLDLDLELDDVERDRVHKFEKRFKSLEGKIKESEDEKASLAEKLAQLEKEKADIEKEKDFLSAFSDVSSKYQNASDFKDKIKEKVLAGYDVEDATVAILNKEGKFTPPKAPDTPPQEKEQIAGGSATNQLRSPESKKVSEMTQQEKMQALIDAETRGDIGLT